MGIVESIPEVCEPTLIRRRQIQMGACNDRSGICARLRTRCASDGASSSSPPSGGRLDFDPLTSLRERGTLARSAFIRFKCLGAEPRDEFITTSVATKEAKDAATRALGRIVLVDGVRLTTLMMDHGVGVSDKAFRVPKVDSDYFEDV